MGNDAMGMNRARFSADGSSRPFWLADLPSVPSDCLSRALTIPLERQAVQMARRWVRETLGRWELGELIDSAVQISSELLANAITHAERDSSVVMLLMFAAGTLRLEVRDHDRQNLPELQIPAPTDVDGRGLVIVEALSDRWGVRVTDAGKSVWSEMDTHRGQRPPDVGQPEGD
jgi:anti-sigma regulatory factor (Ser/Thr protein kinase)